MAVNTIAKRSAALRFGMSHLAGTRPPGGGLGVFERAALLGCYYAVVFGDPTSGWVFGADETVWTFGQDTTVWMLEPDAAVWRFTE